MAAYAFFMRSPDLVGDADKIPELMARMDETIEKHGHLIMPDNIIVGSLNFRRALRSEAYGSRIREWVTDGKITAAMIDGKWTPDGRIKHFTFVEFQEWYNHFNLWGNVKPEPFMALNHKTREELKFFDRSFKKQLTVSRNRDPDYMRALLADLNNPLLRKSFGVHYDTFRTIAEAVYDDGSVEGVIRVTPFARKDGRNISHRFETYLKKANIAPLARRRMMQTIADFSEATMQGVMGRMVEGIPVFAPLQKNIQRIMNCSTPAPATPQRKIWPKLQRLTPRR